MDCNVKTKKIYNFFAFFFVDLCKIRNFAQTLYNMIKYRLIEIRRKRGYSQEYVASVLGTSISGYSRRERGHIKIPNQEWQKLAEILRVRLEKIYESDEGTTL